MTDEDRLKSYNEAEYEAWAKWSGPGEPPRHWWAVNPKTGERTKVYRSYADYCDD